MKTYVERSFRNQTVLTVPDSQNSERSSAVPAHSHPAPAGRTARHRHAGHSRHSLDRGVVDAGYLFSGGHRPSFNRHLHCAGCGRSSGSVQELRRLDDHDHPRFHAAHRRMDRKRIHPALRLLVHEPPHCRQQPCPFPHHLRPFLRSAFRGGAQYTAGGALYRHCRGHGRRSGHQAGTKQPDTRHVHGGRHGFMLRRHRQSAGRSPQPHHHRLCGQVRPLSD